MNWRTFGFLVLTGLTFILIDSAFKNWCHETLRPFERQSLVGEQIAVTRVVTPNLRDRSHSVVLKVNDIYTVQVPTALYLILCAFVAVSWSFVSSLRKMGYVILVAGSFSCLWNEYLESPTRATISLLIAPRTYLALNLGDVAICLGLTLCVLGILKLIYFGESRRPVTH